MRRRVVLAFCSLVLSAPDLLPQQKIENAAMPPASQRQAKLKEIWRLADPGGLALSRPGSIQIAADGTVFLADEKRLLKISPEGRVQKNLLGESQRIGQTPQLSTYLLEADHLLLQYSLPSKIVEVDPSGKPVREVYYSLRGGARLLHYAPPLFYLLAVNFDFDRVRSGDRTQDQVLVMTGGNGRIEETGITFTVTLPDKVLEMGSSRLAKMATSQPVMAAGADSRCFYVACTPEYNIQKVDAKARRVLFNCRRKYQRVPWFPEGSSPSAAPGSRFFVDIMKILARGGMLWVVTSTIEPGKGVLVDVFDPGGKYVDAFFLPLRFIKTPYDIRPAEIAASGDFLYCIDDVSSDSPALVKYQLQLE